MKALTTALLTVAGRIMPPERREWHRAMQAESAYLSAPAALAWSIGTLITAFKQRCMPMNAGDFRVSRWVMLIECVGGFGPLIVGWLDFAFGPSGAIHHTPAIIVQNYLPYPGGGYIAFMWLSGAVIGLIGPIGLLLGLRFALLGHAPRNQTFLRSMIAILLLYSVGGAIAGFLIGPPDYRISAGLTILFVVMPAAVLWHMLQLARPAPRHA